ncbi:hypothetical protein C8R44DRAFT_747165 [Mycena epipterygia]|nr:hypothetical protein C8R44DRAFT_747165 [Mycena epipterygia]
MCGIAHDLIVCMSRIRAGMPVSTQRTAVAAQRSGHARRRRHRPIYLRRHPKSISTTAAGPPAMNSTSRVPPTPAPTSPTVPATPASKLPRFLQSPAQRDRLESLSVDYPRSAASSSAASTSTSSSSGGGRRFLGLGRDTRERERQRISDAERTAPSAAELLTLHESSHNTDDFEYDDLRPPGSPPSA